MEHTYIALIRGVNVGGHSKLNMQELRTICTNLGWHSVTTYINSGNVVFRIATTDTKILGTGLSDAIRNATGLNVAVLVTSLPDLEAIFAYNPFTDVDAALSKESYIMLLDNEPSPDAISSLSPTMFEPDRFCTAAG